MKIRDTFHFQFLNKRFRIGLNDKLDVLNELQWLHNILCLLSVFETYHTVG